MKKLDFSANWKYPARLVVCALFLYFFVNNSLLRPSPGNALVKELAIGMLLLVMCYLNAFVLHPLFFQQNKTLKYMVISVISILVALFVEFSWLYSDIMDCLLRTMTLGEAHSYLWDCALFVALRDIGLLSFTFLICELNSYRLQKKMTENLLMKSDNKIEVKDLSGNNVLLNYRQIRYCEQDRNVTKIYGNEENVFFRYGSLTDIKSLIGDEYLLQISRNTLVARKRIVQYSDGQLWLADEKKPFEVSPKFQDQKELQTLSPMSDNSQKGKEKKKKIPSNEKAKELYRLIANNPDVSAIRLSELSGMSPSTVNRNLNQLKAEGLIAYEGSKKTGGYKAVSS